MIMTAFTLPSPLSISVLVILEDSLQRLSILRLYQPSTPVIKDPLKSAVSLLHGSIGNPHTSINYEDIQLHRQFIIFSMNMLKSGLEKKDEFVHFTQMLKTEQENEEKFSNKILMKTSFDRQVHKEEDTIDTFKKATKIQKLELSMALQNLKNQKQEIIQKKRMQLKLAQAEINQKIQQIKDICHNEIDNINEEVKKYSICIIEENNAHKSFTEEFRKKYNDIKCDEDQFIKYYNSKKDEITGLISYYQKNFKEIHIKLLSLLKKYHEYLAVVEEDRIWKIELKKESDILNIRIAKANNIQNWWRYIIVRDNLLAKTKRKSKKKK